MSKIQRKFGINVDGLRDVDPVEVLTSVKAAGFEAITLQHRDRALTAAVKERADELCMEFPFIHAPFAGINSLWLAGMEYLTILERIKDTIDSAAELGIPYVITHVSSGWNAPAVTDLGLARFDELVLYARGKGVILAFENLRMLGNLAYLIDRYEHMDNVRFCFDCGHEHCYTKTVRWLDIFTHKVVATHIHDNHSRTFEDKVSDGDEHLLPFDGTYDYAPMMQRLDEYGYEGVLLLEISNRKAEYRHLTTEEFLATAYERIKRISEL